MGAMERFSVDGVAPEKRRGYWNDIVGKAFNNVAVDPRDRDFSATMVHQPLGRLDFAYVESGAATVSRLPAQGTEREEACFKIHAQHRGRSLNRQGKREALLNDGDWTLCDTRSPYSIGFTDTNQMLVMKLPQSLLTQRMADPERFVGLRMDGGRPESRMLLSLLRSLTLQSGLPPEADWGASVTDIVLDVVALAYRGEMAGVPMEGLGAGRGALTHWTRRVRAHIDAHIRDPDLSSAAIATALDITQRYVQMVFASLGTTATAYILTRRLELVAAALRASHGPDASSISTIAYDAGFNDLSHFSRSFRAQFGVSPREYRAGRR
ncbi:helix-turn-helix domain-containing protein [Nitrospirillum iridis]|uniref:AraC-like DNA-binding protein n=1 Tax=Nitrospirillum iridis TaxID=765888 RepID=A0A7X0EFK7_9PROT|nr:helix-turn-helix domain-containing protein [Nitrospirillum iridis]MBB6255103.1 AraC-like DNA-binding protein [Nitrospirillum iridis]